MDAEMIRPVDERILVKPKESIEKIGNIIIPDSAKEKEKQQGLVVAVGDIDVVSIGDNVIISKYGSTEIKYDGVTYYLVGRDDILAIIED